MSVVIPVLDEEATIGGLLDSLRAQSRPAEEIVVADGGSTDETLDRVQSYAREGLPVKTLSVAGAFPGEGRNHGVLAARGELIAFTDGGVRVNARWLENLLEPIERDPLVDVVYGHCEPVTDSFFKECAAMAFVPAPVWRDGYRIRAPFIVSSLLRRSVWEAVGGFPPFRAAEDLIFMERIAEKRFRVAYAPGAIAYWQIPGDWAGTFRRFAEYSRHNLIAGRARHWHYGVARMYGAAALFLTLGIVHSPVWVLLPVLGPLARTIKTAYQKRDAFNIRDPWSPRRLLYLLAILLLMDAATAWGFCVWVWRDRVGLRARPRP